MERYNSHQLGKVLSSILQELRQVLHTADLRPEEGQQYSQGKPKSEKNEGPRSSVRFTDPKLVPVSSNGERCKEGCSRDVD